MNSSPPNRLSLIIPALLLAVGIALAGLFASKTLYNAKVAINTAEVKGLAERRVEADRAYWTIGHAVAASSREEVPQLYNQAQAEQNKIIELLKQNGVEDSEITPGVINYDVNEYRNKDQQLVDIKYVLRGSVTVETDKVDMLAKVRTNLNQLVAQGMHIDNNTPAYHFTKLNEIKPDMLQEATLNARIAANEFAENAGVKVGAIRHARQGGFTVVDVGANHGDTKKIEKDVRVVTTITFYLEK